jgi:hypothetical protein
MGTNIGWVMNSIEIEGNEIHETFFYKYHRKDSSPAYIRLRLLTATVRLCG